MIRTLLVALILSAVAWSATLTFPAVGGTFSGPADVDLHSSDLDGTVLTGQGLSLDLLLSSSELARLYIEDPNDFGVLMEVFTDGGYAYSGDTTGYLVDPNGNPIGYAQVAGRAYCPGAFSVGLVGFTTANLGGASVVDIEGVHFDTTFPNTGNKITDTMLRFSFYDSADSMKVGTARELPEPQFLIFGLAVPLLLFGRRFQ